MFAGKVAVLKQHCERAGRDPNTITKVGTMMVGFGEPIGGGRPDPQGWHIVENVSGLTGGIDRFAEAGADEIIFHFNPGRPLEARKETLSAFMQDVAPQYK
jgi:hypothetical protein